MNLEPAIYCGTLRHRRFRPTRHEFSYSLTMAFLDIDCIPETMARSRLTGYNQWRWASFDERDHFGDPSLPLRERLRRDATAQGMPFSDGPIYLLTHLRYLGYCFNPISLYYCFGHEGDAPVVMAEVNSTFGESHNYWVRQGSICHKEMHVSPFMAMNLDYQFALTEPGERLVAHINTLERGERLFDATLTLERQPWTSANLARALARHPFMTAKVIGAIHWEALRLWAKGTPIFSHPEKA